MNFLKSLFVLVLLLATACLAMAQNKNVDKAQEIIEKAIKAHGGKDILNKFKCGSNKFTGTMILEGFSIPFEGNGVNAPDQLKIIMTGEQAGSKITIKQIVDKDKVISKIRIGETDVVNEGSELEHNDLKLAVFDHEIFRLTPILELKKRYAYKAEEPEKVNGKMADVVKVTINFDEKKGTTKETRLFIDQESSLIVKYTRNGLAPGKPDGKDYPLDTYYQEYKSIEGLMVPMKLVSFSNGKKIMESKITDYKPLEKVDAKEFKSDE